MYYQVKVRDHIRVPPNLFGISRKEALLERITKDYEGYISSEFGFVIDVVSIDEMSQGIVIAGDGAAYHECVFDLIVFKPENQEIVLGKIKDIADFGAFISIGPIEGMIHVSQTMDDYVSFSKDKALQGKESGKVLKVGDKCRARIIAVSFKDVTNPKIGLTMRQERLGKIEWLSEKEKAPAAKTGGRAK